MVFVVSKMALTVVIQSKKELECEQLEKDLKIQFARKLKDMREMEPEDRFWALCSIDHALTYEDWPSSEGCRY